MNARVGVNHGYFPIGYGSFLFKCIIFLEIYESDYFILNRVNSTLDRIRSTYLVEKNGDTNLYLLEQYK